jgi:hypothetical protein
MKKISYVDFFVKKKEGKKSVLFREDSFKDIVREKKKKNCQMISAMYQAANVTKAW